MDKTECIFFDNSKKIKICEICMFFLLFLLQIKNIQFVKYFLVFTLIVYWIGKIIKINQSIRGKGYNKLCITI